MRSARTRIFFLGFALFVCFPAMAQERHEVGLSVGGGSLQIDPGGGRTEVFSLTYQFRMTKHFSVEGALDSFYYTFPTGPLDNPSNYKDGYLGAEAAAVYYLLNRDERRFVPFVAAGIGKTSTDFTEIAGHAYYRLGAGFVVPLTHRLGLRLEARDEIIRDLAPNGSGSGNLPSLRCGVFYRF